MSEQYYYFIITFKDVRTGNTEIQSYNNFFTNYQIAWKKCLDYAMSVLRNKSKYYIILNIEHYNHK